MSQPLNYSVKAREALEGHVRTATPLAKVGMGYLARKLAEAEVFVMPDYGNLLDRSKVRPEVPNLMLRPPYPVTALEFQAPPSGGRSVPGYTDAPTSRRIALAWDWKADLPPALARFTNPQLGDGVVIASICYFDQPGIWLPIAVAMHIAYDEPWMDADGPTPFALASLAAGGMTAEQLDARRPRGRPIPILLEAVEGIARARGLGAAMDALSADLLDETAAYLDLCYALACRNVSAQRHAAPDKLNRARAKVGKPPFPDHHTLVLAGDSGEAQALGSADRAGPRSHLRRGHIRRLGADRLTWVNQTMVKGRGGFVSKQYDMRRAGGANG